MPEIVDLRLSRRTSQVLCNASILTLEELCQKTAGEMLKYRNFGQRCLVELRMKLGALGLHLAGEDVFRIDACPTEIDSLEQKQRVLEIELTEVKTRLKELSHAQPRPVPATSVSEEGIWKTLQNLGDFKAVSRALRIPLSKVAVVCWPKLREQVISGTTMLPKGPINLKTKCAVCGKVISCTIRHRLRPTSCPTCAASMMEYLGAIESNANPESRKELPRIARPTPSASACLEERDLYVGGRYISTNGVCVRAINSIEGEYVYWQDRLGSGKCTKQTFLKKVVGFAADSPPPQMVTVRSERQLWNEVLGKIEAVSDQMANAYVKCAINLSDEKRDILATCQTSLSEVELLVKSHLAADQ